MKLLRHLGQASYPKSCGPDIHFYIKTLDAERISMMEKTQEKLPASFMIRKRDTSRNEDRAHAIAGTLARKMLSNSKSMATVLTGSRARLIKERRRHVVGMWSDIREDSVKIQKSLREDWV